MTAGTTKKLADPTSRKHALATEMMTVVLDHVDKHGTEPDEVLDAIMWNLVLVASMCEEDGKPNMQTGLSLAQQLLELCANAPSLKELSPQATLQ